MRTTKKTNPDTSDSAKPRSGVDRRHSGSTKPAKALRSEGKTTRSGVAEKPRLIGKNPPKVALDTTKPRRTGTKLSRLLDLKPVTNPVVNSPVENIAVGRSGQLQQWLLYCRPGFEQDCAQEAINQARKQRPVLAVQTDIKKDSGYAIATINEQALLYNELIFARQLIRLHHNLNELSERDRLSPVLAAIEMLPGPFSAVWLEVPDTNDGKTLSAFTRRFQPLLETALNEQNRLSVEDTVESRKLPRLHVFFPDKSSVLIGTSDPYNSASSLMGIVRQSMPAEAPSRSTLKLAEAIEVFMDKSEQARLLRSGMSAVDLGAAPGGWSWQMVKRGIRVTAVDNGPMKGVMEHHPLVEHLMQDGFKFVPRKSVDWLICDMVEKPAKVAALIGNWFAAGWCKHAIFNLKLPMKQRVAALDSALNGIRSRLDTEGISYKMIARQLYHDREEITVFLSKTRIR
jgi:23S rRNA (cytidine2498-2'-O)-methyltransferase